MKFYPLILTGLASLSCGLLLAGCTSTEYGNTSPYQPGPVAGKTVGNAVGVTAGNVAGFGVGTVEGDGAWPGRAVRSQLPHGASVAHGNHGGWPDDSGAVRRFGGSIWPPGEHARADGESRSASGHTTAANTNNKHRGQII